MGADLEVTAEDGASVLDLAMQRHSASTVSLMLEKGVDINTPSPDGIRAVHEAAARPYTAKLLQEMIKADTVDLGVADAHGWTALHVCTTGLAAGLNLY